MKEDPAHSLSAWQVAISIVSMHYGLGMLVGTGQDILQKGPIGLLYAISTAFGTFGLLIFSNFYWKTKYPLWDLLQAKYGKRPALVASFLSSFWMMGVIASFLLGGSAAAKLFGVSYVQSVLLLLFTIYVLSLTNIRKLSKVFLWLLLIGSGMLVYVNIHQGFQWNVIETKKFIFSLSSTSPTDNLSIFLTTFLVTIIGMDFHQFVVRAKTPAVAKRGIIMASLLLITLSVILGGTVLGALPLISTADGTQVIPIILLQVGKQLAGNLAPIFILPIIFVAVSSGSGITKIIATSIQDISSIRILQNRPLLHALVLFFAFLISLMSSSVIQLIVAFYAMYIAAILVPFLAYLLERKKLVCFNEITIFSSMVVGFLTALGLFVMNSILAIYAADVSFYMIMLGIGASFIMIILKKLESIYYFSLNQQKG